MISRDQIWGKDLIRGLPRVIRIWVPFPLDQVLELVSPPEVAVVYNSLHLKFFFSGD